MYVIEQATPQPAELPGISHATWAGAADGLRLSVWRQSLAPGAATPPHVHECDEVVFCLGGRGELLVDGEVHAFGADTTIVLPKHRVHQLRNAADEPLELLAAFGESPVRTRWPDGTSLDVPWRT